MEVLLAFIIAFVFGMIFQVPKNTLLACGLTGAIGWLSFMIVDSWQTTLMATLFAAITVGVCGEIFARVYKTPVTVFVIVGFIPLVPGSKAYNTILLLTGGEFGAGMELGLQTIFTACAIGLGLSITSSFTRIFKQNFKK